MEPVRSEAQREDQRPERRLERWTNPGCWGKDPDPDPSELWDPGPECMKWTGPWLPPL